MKMNKPLMMMMSRRILIWALLLLLLVLLLFPMKWWSEEKLFRRATVPGVVLPVELARVWLLPYTTSCCCWWSSFSSIPSAYYYSWQKRSPLPLKHKKNTNSSYHNKVRGYFLWWILFNPNTIEWNRFRNDDIKFKHMSVRSTIEWTGML